MKRLIVIPIFAAIAFNVQAAQPTKPAVKPKPAISMAAKPFPELFANIGLMPADVLENFPVGDGIQGWVIKMAGPGQPAEPTLVYTSANNKYLIAGALIDEKGGPLTPGHWRDHVDGRK